MSSIPPEVVSKYRITDEDTAFFLRHFDEPVGRVLEVAAHDEPVANILAECHYEVTGVDLREYNPRDAEDKEDAPKLNYRYIRKDFCDTNLHNDFGDLPFDVVIALSAIEHFGLDTYGEGPLHHYYDVIAARKVWELLREGGVFYLSVPYGGLFIEAPPDWRVYDEAALLHRLIQDFHLEEAHVFVAGDCVVDGRPRQKGEVVTWEEAEGFLGIPPHLSVLVKLVKTPVLRLAPDGR